MDATLFSFIWKHSRRQQLMLLAVTLATFPFLYASLELPKRIINDAIGARAETVSPFGVTMSQEAFLLALCLAFLATVLVAGLMKMRLNTMKGVTAERLLRRLRYQLIERMMRFPAPYFRATSQGELVSMISSESEPMGGLMGDAVAQPVFQAGQMLTILAFLFAQSVWFGLASVALIPLQAWLIPKLQRQINLLNKDRITEIRHLSSEIGETAAGVSDLRINGGRRYRLAQFTDRLGRLFEIRFRIYQKKFFMKFLNNFITQLTPFFFYLIGGLLAIRGEITVGALVAALAAYKDLSSPWNELLTFYNQVQDMSLRWQIVTERFAPPGTLDAALFEGEPDEIPRLDGPIELDDVTVREADGTVVLEDVTLTIPPGSRVAVQSTRAAERAAFAQLLTREVMPARGRVTLSGHDLNDLHQSVLATRIGHANSRPYFFDGTLGDNLLMPLRIRPREVAWDPDHKDRRAEEALRSGNSTDRLDMPWLDPGLAGLGDDEDIRAWWFELAEALGAGEQIFRRALHDLVDPLVHPDLACAVVALRPRIAKRLADAGLADAVHRFDPEAFNPAIPLGGNLLFAAPRRRITQGMLAEDARLHAMLRALDLEEEALRISQGVVETLRQTFGQDGTDHPLFRRLGMDEDTYRRLCAIVDARAADRASTLADDERALLLTVPFLLTAEQIGPNFSERYQREILDIRRESAPELRAAMADSFMAIEPDVYFPRLTLMENAIYGRVSMLAGAREDAIEDLVAEVFAAHDLRRPAAAVIHDLPVGIGGVNLPTVIQERAAFNRAAIKRPDILIMDTVLASHDSRSRHRAREALRDLMPDTTLIFMENRFDHPEVYDLFVEIVDGRIDGVAARAGEAADAGTQDFRRKLRVISNTELFETLDARNQRLLAFSAQWFEAKAGEVIFRHGDAPDAAYLCLEGAAELRWPDPGPGDQPVTRVGPGRLIGDLSIIIDKPRPMDLVAVAESRFLRIGAAELRAVIENDRKVAAQMLQTVAGNLTVAAESFRRMRAGQDVALDSAGAPAGPEPAPASLRPVP